MAAVLAKKLNRLRGMRRARRRVPSRRVATPISRKVAWLENS